MTSLYLIKAGKNYKIGWTRNIQKRVVLFQTGNASRIKIIGDYPTNMPIQALEAWFHEAFRDKRVRGEWFKLNDSDLIKFGELLVSPKPKGFYARAL